MAMKRRAVLAVATLLALTAFVLVPSPLSPVGHAHGQGPPALTLRLTIYNGAPKQLVGPWNVKVVFPSSSYSAFINANFSNVAFLYPNGSFIPAWVESNASSASATTVVWLRMNVSLASHATTAIRFRAYATNVFEPSKLGPIGMAPLLSGTYASTDDGALVFPFYDNFRGSTLNGADWVTSMASGAVTVNNGITSNSAQTGGATQATCGIVAATQNLTGRGYVEDIYGQAGSGSRTGPFTSSNHGSNTCAGTANTVVQALDPAPGTLTQYTIFSQASAGSYNTNTVAFTWKQTANYLWSLQSYNNSTGIHTSVNYTSAVGGPFANLSVTTVYPGIWFKATSGSIGPWYWARERPAFPSGISPTVNITLLVGATGGPSLCEVGSCGVHFNGTATGGTTPYRFSWAWGDGTYTNDTGNTTGTDGTVHTYATSGIKAAVLTVTDAGVLTASAYVNTTVVRAVLAVVSVNATGGGCLVIRTYSTCNVTFNSTVSYGLSQWSDTYVVKDQTGATIYNAGAGAHGTTAFFNGSHHIELPVGVYRAYLNVTDGHGVVSRSNLTFNVTYVPTGLVSSPQSVGGLVYFIIGAFALGMATLVIMDHSSRRKSR